MLCPPSPPPDGGVVADDEFVVHQIRPAVDRDGRERERLEQARLGLRRRGDGNAVAPVEVVGELDAHAALVGADERGSHDVGRLVVQAHVVQGQIERPAGAVEKRRQLPRDLQRGLTAVGEGAGVRVAVAAGAAVAVGAIVTPTVDEGAALGVGDVEAAGAMHADGSGHLSAAMAKRQLTTAITSLSRVVLS